MVNRRKLHVIRITTAVLIGIFIFVQFGSVWIEAGTINNESVSVHNKNMTPLAWTAIIVGGCIVLTLSYVSWQKYKAEVKGKKRGNKDKSVD